MSKPQPLPMPPLSLKGLSSVFRFKPQDELGLFLRLIRKRRFDEALEIMQQGPEEITRLVEKYMNLDPPRDEPFLHLILQSQPPLAVVNTILSAVERYMGEDLTPDESVNVRKQTPLHVACYSQCSADIIRRLIEGRSGMIPAICRDEDGRFPLHLLFMADHMGPLNQVMDIVNQLLDCDCFVAHAADSYDNTPLDYARAKRVNDRIIDLLLEARIHLDDDDRQPDDGEQSVKARPIPGAVECDLMVPDDVSELDMTETRPRTSSTNFGWDEISNEFDDYLVVKPP